MPKARAAPRGNADGIAKSRRAKLRSWTAAEGCLAQQPLIVRLVGRGWISYSSTTALCQSLSQAPLRTRFAIGTQESGLGKCPLLALEILHRALPSRGAQSTSCGWRFFIHGDQGDALILPDVFEEGILPSAARLKFLWRWNRLLDFTPKLPFEFLNCFHKSIPIGVANHK